MYNSYKYVNLTNVLGSDIIFAVTNINKFVTNETETQYVVPLFLYLEVFMKTVSRWLFRVMTVLFFVGAALAVMPVNSVKANQTEYIDTLKAGAALILDADITEEDEALVTYAMELNGGAADLTEQEEEEEESTLVMADVQSVLNVRADADENAEIVGAMYADCGGQILNRKNGWTLLQSGNLVGWAKDDYLLFGEEAEKFASEVGVNLATSLTGGLRVRKEPSADAGVYGFMAQGDVVEVYEILDEWIKIDFEGYEGYVSSEYVTVTFLIDKGETVEEIALREAAEAEAKAKAEAEAAARRAELTAQQEAIAATYSEVELLAALIWCEAGNQGYEGQLAVGAVVMNRVRSAAYPNTIQGVIYASGQFPPALNGKVARVLEKGVNASCLQAAQDAINGNTNVGTAMHFNRVGTHSDGIIIGAHIFW